MQNENYRMLERIYSKLVNENRLYVGDYTIRDLVHDTIVDWQRTSGNNFYHNEKHLYHLLRQRLFQQRGKLFNKNDRNFKRLSTITLVPEYGEEIQPACSPDEDINFERLENVVQQFPFIKMHSRGYSVHDISRMIGSNPKDVTTNLNKERKQCQHLIQSDFI